MNTFLVVLTWVVALAASIWLGAWLTGRLLARIDAADRKARASERKQAADGGNKAADAETLAPVAIHVTGGAPDGVDSPRVRDVLRGGWWIGVL